MRWGVLLLFISELGFSVKPITCPYLIGSILRTKEILLRGETKEDRPFQSLVAAFGDDFKRTVLTGKVRWMDQGTGQALPQRGIITGEGKYPNPDLYFTGVGLKRPSDPLYESFLKRLQKEGKAEQFNILTRDFLELPPDVVGPQDVITDLIGVLSYTHDFDTALEKSIGYLKPGGRLYTCFGDSGESLKFFKRDGTEISIADYFRMVSGVKLVEETPVLVEGKIFYRVVVERTEGPIRAPALEAKVFLEEGPPVRSYWVEG